MFGKRSATNEALAQKAPPPPAQVGLPPKADTPPPAPRAAAAPANQAPRSEALKPSQPARVVVTDNKSEDYYQIKTTIFSALIDTIDLAQLAQLDPDSARGLPSARNPSRGPGARPDCGTKDWATSSFCIKEPRGTFSLRAG